MPSARRARLVVHCSSHLGPADYANAAERTTGRAARRLVWLAILILYVVWGSTYLGIRIAIESIPPFVMASARFAASPAS